jgi:hypothetical protein
MAFAEFAPVFLSGVIIGASLTLLYIAMRRSEPTPTPAPQPAPRIIPPQGGSGTAPPRVPEQPPATILPFPAPRPLRAYRPPEGGDMLADETTTY